MESGRESVGICQRLFNFLIDVFLSGGLKRVTLGGSIDHGEAVSTGCGCANTIGSTLDKVEHSPGIEGTSKFKIDFMKANGLSMKDVGQTQEEGYDVDSTHRHWTLELGKADDIPASTTTDGILMTAKNDSKAVPSGANSEASGLSRKMVTIEDGAEERETQRKKKGKNKAVMEETLAPNHSVPIIWSVFNIDQRSDELIRRTREALRSSSGVEAGSS